MQSVQRLWGEKFIKVWYNKSHAAGRFPYNDKNEGMHMANGIIFLVGALIMFYMALRSVRQRRSLCTNGEKVQARITGTVQSRDGTAYVLEFTTAGGSHRLQYLPQQEFCRGQRGDPVLRPGSPGENVCGGR